MCSIHGRGDNILAEVHQWVAEGKIKSSATVISLLWLQLNEARLIAENDS